MIPRLDCLPLVFILAAAGSAAEPRCSTGPESCSSVRRAVAHEDRQPVRPARHPALPPLPEGVVDLKFSDFFKSPVGPRGLELTDRLHSLDGMRARLLGYMVQQTDPTPRSFLLSPRPAKLHEREYGLADELSVQRCQSRMALR